VEIKLLYFIVFVCEMSFGMATICQNSCLNFETRTGCIFAFRYGSSLHPPGTGQVLMTSLRKTERNQNIM
jgi:hypothetical protein